jgi:lipopolysaccharide/colanic/teichoic acid biosynthesis glycosyltransferase
MRIWPVILDSQPIYLTGRGRSASLLLAPLGPGVLIEYVADALARVTDNPPLVVASEDVGPEYAGWVRALCPRAQVVTMAREFADAITPHELSDALFFVDPRCLPVHGLKLSELVRHHTTEPRVAHHLVAFERASAGTRERVCFDTNGHVRSIQRHYEQATWPFIAGVSASLVPSACGVASEAKLPRSLAELRQLLINHGVPGRDLPIDGGALDLNEERGMLAANEQLILETSFVRNQGDASSPVYVGNGHSIHPTARVMGPVIVHPDAWIDANATVLGPAVVGGGARIGAGAVVAHATIGPDCVVPPNVTVRDRAWFKGAGEHLFGAERPPLSFSERLARVSFEATPTTPVQSPLPEAAHARGLKAKRCLDATMAAISLTLLSPLFALIAMAIWVESRGPVFYGDKREGMGGRGFRCWKFRTMFTGAHLAQRDLKALDHTDGPHFKVDRDPRVTKVGRILRALNIDELPQLFNVFIGEMSLVGPRPSPFRENQVCVPWRAARLSVRPGITGFWQVCRHNRAAGDFHQWIEYDLLYVQHLSFWLDVKILAATFGTLGGKVLHVPASWLVQQETPALPENPFVQDAPVAQDRNQAERVA